MCFWWDESEICPGITHKDAVMWPLNFFFIFHSDPTPVSSAFLLFTLALLSMWSFIIKESQFSHIEAPHPKRVIGERPLKPRLESHETLLWLNSVGHSMLQAQPRLKDVKIDSALDRRYWKVTWNGLLYRMRGMMVSISENYWPQLKNLVDKFYHILYFLILNNPKWLLYSART